MSVRRIVAVVLPELLSELATEALLSKANNVGTQPPVAVVMDTERTAVKLVAANRTARRFGVSVGQTVVEAKAFLSQLLIHSVSQEQVQLALARIAEVAMGFARLVSVESVEELNGSRPAPDTVWLDITGIAHLRGGEQELAEELAEELQALGHEVRIAVASGKLLAQAFARWSRPQRGLPVQVVRPEQTRKYLAELPVVALPLDTERTSWLVRLGMFSVADVMALPASAALSRLGAEAEQVLALCSGKDDAPLVPYQPNRQLVEERAWEQPVAGVSPLSFVLRGLASRLSARLAGRGEAALAFELSIVLDPSIAQLREVAPRIELRFDLASPLWKERDLLRVVSSRVERLKLGAPSLGIRWVIPSITHAVERQLELARALGGAFSGSHEDLPIVLAELNADLGKHKLGILSLQNAHRPESKSALVPALGQGTTLKKRRAKTKLVSSSKRSTTRHKTQSSDRKRAGQSQQPQLMQREQESSSDAQEPLKLRKTTPASVLEDSTDSRLGSPPTRFFAAPIRFHAPLKRGATVSLNAQLYSVQALSFEYRLDAIEWWERPVSRDYFRVLLRGPKSVFEGLVFVERDSGKRFLQAVFD